MIIILIRVGTVEDLKKKIYKLTHENNFLKSQQISAIDQDHHDNHSYILRIIKSTLLTYLKVDSDKKQDTFKILCKLLNIEQSEMEKIVIRFSNKFK